MDPILRNVSGTRQSALGEGSDVPCAGDSAGPGAVERGASRLAQTARQVMFLFDRSPTEKSRSMAFKHCNMDWAPASPPIHGVDSSKTRAVDELMGHACNPHPINPKPQPF